MSVQEFEQYYQKEIAPQIQQWESYRKSAFRTATKIKLLLVVLFVIWVLVAIYSSKLLFSLQVNYDPFDYILPYSSMMLIILGVGLHKLKLLQKKFHAFIGDELFKKIINFYPDLFYLAQEGVKQELINEIGFFANYNIFIAKNLVTGKFNHLNIEFSDLYLARHEYEYRDGKQYSKEVIVFKGFFLLSDVSKNLSSTTYIIPDSIMNLFKDLPSSLKRVTLEDPVFERCFDVYSDNQIEARYLLTTSFMERLTALNKLRQIKCCFIGQKMYLAVWQEHGLLPEVKLSQNINSTIIMQIFENFQIVFNILDILKIDMKIGL